MANAILIQNDVMAKDVGSLNRSAKSAAVMENGYLVSLTAKETGVGETDLWTVAQPTTGDLYGLWMVAAPEVVITASKYKGLDPDPRNFDIPIGDPVDCFKPMVGDIFTLTADGISGSVDTHIVAANAAWIPAWASAVAAATFSAILIKTTTISIGLGTIASQKVVAYEFEVLDNQE